MKTFILMAAITASLSSYAFDIHPGEAIVGKGGSSLYPEMIMVTIHGDAAAKLFKEGSKITPPELVYLTPNKSNIQKVQIGNFTCELVTVIDEEEMKVKSSTSCYTTIE